MSCSEVAEKTLVIDMTPTCVNRTAIYHIAIDTAAALAGMTAALQYCGSICQPPEDRYAQRNVQEGFLRDLAAWSCASPHSDEIDEFYDDGDRWRRLYFDPIYTLYRPLQSCDVVFVLDLTPLTNPEWHNSMVSRAYERAFRKLACSSARIVSISENCTAALRANFAIPSKDIVTVPLYLREIGVKGANEPIKSLVNRRFFLFVGSLETRKNLRGLLQAFALSGLADAGWLLAIAGGDGEGAERIRAEAITLKGVQLLGFVSDPELAWLYANTAAFVYPSYLEGFGLPLVEAMSHGVPCMASLTGASSEICGELCILVDPYEMQSLVDGLLECAAAAEFISEADRRRLAARGRSYSFERYIAALMPSFT